MSDKIVYTKSDYDIREHVRRMDEAREAFVANPNPGTAVHYLVHGLGYSVSHDGHGNWKLTEHLRVGERDVADSELRRDEARYAWAILKNCAPEHAP